MPPSSASLEHVDKKQQPAWLGTSSGRRSTTTGLPESPWVSHNEVPYPRSTSQAYRCLADPSDPSTYCRFCPEHHSSPHGNATDECPHVACDDAEEALPHAKQNNRLPAESRICRKGRSARRPSRPKNIKEVQPSRNATPLYSVIPQWSNSACIVRITGSVELQDEAHMDSVSLNKNTSKRIRFSEAIQGYRLSTTDAKR